MQYINGPVKPVIRAEKHLWIRCVYTIPTWQTDVVFGAFMAFVIGIEEAYMAACLRLVVLFLDLKTESSLMTECVSFPYFQSVFY